MKWLSKLGPGLLYAGAAVGVSHLVQSTTAGAKFGYLLILAIIVVHILKYPFLKLGPLYTQQNGKTLITGISELGPAYRAVLIALTASTMFIIQAAVTMVTSALISRFINTELTLIALVLLIICGAILLLGNYKGLDMAMKIIILILTISTVVAAISSFSMRQSVAFMDFTAFSWTNQSHFLFLLAFVGWMPAPLDITLWQSVWTKEKMDSGTELDVKSTRFDFNVGFFGTALLAIIFLLLGAHLFYGTSEEVSPIAGKFANQLLDLYSTSLGPAFFGIAAIAAITTMFSTTLTCLDAMPKVMNELISAGNKSYRSEQLKKSRGIMTLLTGIGALVIIAFFRQNLGSMVLFATVISFLAAPILGVMCILLEKRSSKRIWKRWENVLAWIGMIILGSVSLIFLWMEING